MRRVLCLALTAFIACTYLNPVSAQESPTPPASQEPWGLLSKLELADGDSIVFLGDSITHQRLYTQYVEDYFYTRMPHLRLKLHNAGVGGARAWDALQRFDQDVAAYHPKYVTILLGMNDGTYRAYDDPTFQTYRQDMTELLAKIQGIGATAIPMTPTMFDSGAARNPRKPRDPSADMFYNSVLTYYGTWLREVAQRQQLGFVDMWGPLNNLTLEQRKKDPTFTMIPDAVHPGPDGQLVMASAIITDTGLPRSVSTITIDLNAKGKQQIRVTGGELTDLQKTADGVSFTWMAKSLPWVVPADAQKGARLLNIGHRLGREALEVHGLAEGKYTLTIDGVDVGAFPASTLAHHIELQSNEKTPQYQQALQVATINKERNEGPISNLRGEWARFQQYARAKRDSSADPNNMDAKAQFEKLDKVVPGIEQRVAEHNAAAKKLEDKIFEVNQPKARKYVLARVKD